MADRETETPSLHAALGGLAGAEARAGFCGDIDMRIARDGTWYYRGGPIGRKRLVRLFASALIRDAAGDYWLATPAERARIAVEDAPFLAVEMKAEGRGRAQRLRFRTNVDDWVGAGPEHPIEVRPRPMSGEPAPYLRVRDSLDALIARAVYYDLVELGVAHDEAGARRFGVWSGGVFFALAPEVA